MITLRLTILSRTLSITAWPWSARLDHAEPQIVVAPAPPEEPSDLIAEIDQLSRYAAVAEIPLVSESPSLLTTKATGGHPDASEWGFLNPDAARRRAVIAHRQGYADVLHYLAEDVAWFGAAVVRHHLSPSPESRREVERCGVAAAVQIVAIVRRVNP